MKGIKSFLNGFVLFAIVIFLSLFIGEKIHQSNSTTGANDNNIAHTDYGDFLAAQHALYVNDFANAADFISNIKSENSTVSEAKFVTDFFNGKMPDGADKLKNEKDLIKRTVYDAYLIQNDKWGELYKRHEKNDSLLYLPLRVFSAVKQGKSKEALKYIDSLKTHDSWKAFMRGQVAVLNNDIDKAAKEFADVHPDFMNINDYMYLMSFYKEHGMTEDMEILRDDFIAKPAGMFVLNYPDVPDWSNYAGYKNNLVFSVIQNISHTQVMIYTDLSLMFLRFAELIANETNRDAVNYYMGQYYSFNHGDYKKAFNSINSKSPFYLFGQLKIAEKADDMDTIEKMAHKNPLFVPAVNKVILENIRNGNESKALRAVNRTLKHKHLTDNGRVFFLKQRAHLHLMFGRAKAAQKDLDTIEDMYDYNMKRPDIVFLQTQIWILQKRNLDKAYNYAMSLVKLNTSDVNAWDLVAMIVAEKENVFSAIEILERVSEVAVNVSSLYEHLGDLYVKHGDKDRALAAYQRAIDLSADCLVVVPNVQKKIRKLK